MIYPYTMYAIGTILIILLSIVAGWIAYFYAEKMTVDYTEES